MFQRSISAMLLSVKQEDEVSTTSAGANISRRSSMVERRLPNPLTWVRFLPSGASGSLAQTVERTVEARDALMQFQEGPPYYLIFQSVVISNRQDFDS